MLHWAERNWIIVFFDTWDSYAKKIKKSIMVDEIVDLYQFINFSAMILSSIKTSFHTANILWFRMNFKIFSGSIMCFQCLSKVESYNTRWSVPRNLRVATYHDSSKIDYIFAYNYPKNLVVSSKIGSLCVSIGRSSISIETFNGSQVTGFSINLLKMANMFHSKVYSIPQRL